MIVVFTKTPSRNMHQRRTRRTRIREKEEGKKREVRRDRVRGSVRKGRSIQGDEKTAEKNEPEY